MREHLIPRAREPRPIVNSGGAAGGEARRSRKGGNRRDFLGQDFFFHGAYFAHETHRADGFSGRI